MLTRRIATGLVNILLVMAATAGPHAIGDGLRRGSDSHTTTEFSPMGNEVVEWAVALFDEAGLPLPGIDFTQHGSTGPCRGRPGWHERQGERSTIDICIDGPRASVEFLVLHELAHAWDRHHLTDERRAAFLEVRGLDRWWGADPEHWHEYGAEQSAEVVVWAVFDRPVRSARIPAPHNDCDHLLAGYRALTGRPPLHGYTDRCDPHPWS
jgi:hypothetical protein